MLDKKNTFIYTTTMKTQNSFRAAMYLKEVRTLLSWSREELAEHLNVTLLTIRNWENMGIPDKKVSGILRDLHLTLDHQQYDLITHERMFFPMELSYDF